MRIDSDYARFLSSDDPHKYLVRKITEAEGVREIAPLADFLQATKAMEAADDKDGIDAEIISFLSRDSSFILDSIRTWIKNTAEDSKALPPFRDAIEFDSALFHNINLVKKFGISLTVSSICGQDIAIGRKRGEGTRVVFSGQMVFFKFLSGEPVTLGIWECDKYSDDSDFRLLKCRKARDVRVGPGDVLAIDGSYQSLSFGECEGTAVFLQVENLTRDIGTSVAFEKTGDFIATFPTDRTALRRMVMCSALKHMGTDDRLTELPESARRGPFYQRWHFLREIVAAAPDEGAALLATVANDDPSAPIRRAASATLNMLEQRRRQDVA